MDIDQEKKGRPGHQTADTTHQTLSTTSRPTGWLSRAALWDAVHHRLGQPTYARRRCEMGAMAGRREE